MLLPVSQPKAGREGFDRACKSISKIDPIVAFRLLGSVLHASDLREMISDRFTALKSAGSKRHEISTGLLPITETAQVSFPASLEIGIASLIFFFFVCPCLQNCKADKIVNLSSHFCRT